MVRIFYLELNRHGLDEEDHVNLQLLKYAKEYGIKYIAANNTFYLTQENAEAHDILLCVKEGAQKVPQLAVVEASVTDSLIKSFISRVKRKWLSCFPICLKH